MNKIELRKFRELLEARKSELELFLRNRDSIAIETFPEVLDAVQQATERELAIRNLDRESNLLRRVRSALRRIDEEAFGCVCTAKKTSAPSAWQPCRGPRCASTARRSPTRRATNR